MNPGDSTRTNASSSRSRSCVTSAGSGLGMPRSGRHGADVEMPSHQRSGRPPAASPLPRFEKKAEFVFAKRKPRRVRARDSSHPKIGARSELFTNGRAARPAGDSLARHLDLSASMLVRDLMQAEVATLKLSDSLGLAEDIMELGRIRHLPVLSGSVVVGVVSQRDLYRAAVSSMLAMSRSAEREWLAKIPVHSVMSQDVHTIEPDASVHRAVEMMLARRIGCLPVVEHGKLVG